MQLDKTQLRLDKIQHIINCLAIVEGENIKGDFAEVGVLQGGITRMISRAITNRTVYAFDTFTGLPKAQKIDGRHINIRQANNETLFKDYGQTAKEYIAAKNVVICEGLFPETFYARQMPSEFAFVHLDTDLYEGTKSGLEIFPQLMPVSGFIVVDDYMAKHTPGVTAAVDEYMAIAKGWKMDNKVSGQIILRRCV